MKSTATYNEENIIQLFRCGGDKEFKIIFNKFYKLLCFFARTITQDAVLAEDVVSDCFFKLWQNRENFHSMHNIKAFLYISCRNSCLNQLRNLKRLNTAQEHYFNQLDESEDTIVYQIIESEVLGLLSEEIDELPSKCREVFKMMYIDNFKPNEISDLLGISVKTVRGHKARAIELLKTQLLKKGISFLVFSVIFFLLEEY